jgi:hypothetical protein
MDDQLTPNDLARELGTTGRAVREVLRRKYGKLEPPETRWRLDEAQAQYVRSVFAADRDESAGQGLESPATRPSRVVKLADIERDMSRRERDNRGNSAAVQAVLGGAYRKSVLGDAIGTAVLGENFGKSVLNGALGGPAFTAAFSRALSPKLPSAAFSGIAEGVLTKFNESMRMTNLTSFYTGQLRAPGIEAMMSGLRQQISVRNSFAGALQRASPAARLPFLAEGILATSSGITGWKGISERIGASFARQWTASLFQPSFENALRQSVVADVLASSLTKTVGINVMTPALQQAFNGIAQTAGLSPAVTGILGDAAVRSAFSGIGRKIVDEWIETVQDTDQGDVDEQFEDLAERWATELTERAPAVDALADNQELVRRGFQFSRLRRMPTSRAGKLTLAWLAFWFLFNLVVIGLVVDPSFTVDSMQVTSYMGGIGLILYKWGNRMPATGHLSDEARAQVDKMNDDTKDK